MIQIFVCRLGTPVLSMSLCFGRWSLSMSWKLGLWICSGPRVFYSRPGRYIHPHGCQGTWICPVWVKVSSKNSAADCGRTRRFHLTHNGSLLILLGERKRPRTKGEVIQVKTQTVFSEALTSVHSTHKEHKEAYNYLLLQIQRIWCSLLGLRLVFKCNKNNTNTQHKQVAIFLTLCQENFVTVGSNDATNTRVLFGNRRGFSALHFSRVFISIPVSCL